MLKIHFYMYFKEICVDVTTIRIGLTLIPRLYLSSEKGHVWLGTGTPSLVFSTTFDSNSIRLS